MPFYTDLYCIQIFECNLLNFSNQNNFLFTILHNITTEKLISIYISHIFKKAKNYFDLLSQNTHSVMPGLKVWVSCTSPGLLKGSNRLFTWYHGAQVSYRYYNLTLTPLTVCSSRTSAVFRSAHCERMTIWDYVELAWLSDDGSSMKGPAINTRFCVLFLVGYCHLQGIVTENPMALLQ